MASVHGPMAGLRVLEVGQELGAWCAKLLGDMGAEVTKVEPPEGDRTRTYPPFHKGEVDGDKSLFYWYYNTNKKSVTLDIELGPRARSYSKPWWRRPTFWWMLFPQTPWTT